MLTVIMKAYIQKLWEELTVSEQKIAIGISVIILLGIAVRWWHIMIY